MTRPARKHPRHAYLADQVFRAERRRRWLWKLLHFAIGVAAVVASLTLAAFAVANALAAPGADPHREAPGQVLFS
jgi:hypothetical protein